MKSFVDKSAQEILNSVYQDEYKSFTQEISGAGEVEVIMPTTGVTMVSMYTAKPIYYSFIAGATATNNPDRHFFEGGRLSFALSDGKSALYIAPVSYVTNFTVYGTVG